MWWGIRDPGDADWPQQSRLLEVFDNHDGTLSIFGTVLDHASPPGAPRPAPPGRARSSRRARLARAPFPFNDPQVGSGPIGEGRPLDRNVELLLIADRAARPPVTS